MSKKIIKYVYLLSLFYFICYFSNIISMVYFTITIIDTRVFTVFITLKQYNFIIFMID